MTRKMTIFWVCFLVFSLNTASWAAVQDILELRVKDAETLALENNLDYRLVLLDWQQVKMDLERAQIVKDPDMLKDAEKEWEKSERYHQEQRRNLQSLVQNSYQELLEKETMLINVEKARERAENQLNIDKNKFQAGLLSSLDIERAKNSLFDAEYSYQRAIIDLETQRQKFNELLGLSFDQKVILVDRLLLDFVPIELEFEQCYELGLEHDQGVLAAQEGLQKAKEAVEIAKGPFTPRAELDKALFEYEKAKIYLQQSKQTLYFSIRSAYYGLLDQAHNLQTLERIISLEQQNLKAEESKYAAGVLSNVQVVAQQEKLAQLEQEYSSALLKYSLSRLNLLQTIGEQGFWGEQHEN